MKHEFTVRFRREVSEDLESAEENFPGRPIPAQLTAQLCAELDENPVLRGTYTVAESTIDNGNEEFIVFFAFENKLADCLIARMNFQTILQETYDRYGMAGTFRIFPDIAD
jgi:hypothetical protein